MAISDTIVGNLTTLYLVVIASMKAYGLMSGQSYGGGFVLIVSTTIVGLLLILSLTWDVSRKVKYALTRHHNHPIQQLYHQPRHHSDESCRGGICWHGVAVRSPASQVRFRLPQQYPAH